MPRTLIIKSDGKIETTYTPVHKATDKYKKHITNVFERALPSLVFRRLGISLNPK